MTEPQQVAPNPDTREQNDVLPAIVKILAAVWFVISLGAGLNFIMATPYSMYGGDAYTGIQNAVARGTNALGFLVLGSGVIAFVLAFRNAKE